MMLGLSCEPLPARGVTGSPSSGALGAFLLSPPADVARGSEIVSGLGFFLDASARGQEAAADRKEEGITGFND